MTRRYLTITALLVLLSLAPAAVGQGNKTPTAKKPAATAPKSAPKQAEPWTKIPVPPLPAFKPRQPTRIVFTNGMVVYLQEDHELPFIGVSARIRGGSLLVPPDKTGLTTIYGSVWRSGGTKSKTGDQMDDFLESHAASIETGGGTDSTSISLNCLKGDFDDVFALFLDLFNNPEFREDKIDLSKRSMNAGISRRNDDADRIIGRESGILAYGKDNPYVRQVEYATVAAITRQDLLDWHKKYTYPNNIILSVEGDFDTKTMEARLRRVFEGWPKGPDAPKPAIQFRDPKPGLYFIPKDDVNQSNIAMVTLGTRRDNPDYYAIVAMNEVLGGGFSSRLFSNVRSKKGLAYDVGGGLGAAYDHPGIFGVSMSTKSASTAEAIKALYEELEGLSKNPVTPTELNLAKDSILNSFIFSMDSPGKTLSQRVTYEFYGYPSDFLERFRAGIDKVTVADVAGVVQKYVDTKKFAVLVVGNPNELGTQLTAMGPVTDIDITIPPPPGSGNVGGKTAPVDKSSATTPQARALIQKVIEGLGGRDKVQSVKSYSEKASRRVNTREGEMSVDTEGTVVFPDQLRMTMTTPAGEMVMVVTPNGGFRGMGPNVQDMPSKMRQDGLNSIKRNVLYVAQHASDPKFAFVVGGTEKIGNIEAAVLDVNADGSRVRWFVDPKTGHILRIFSEEQVTDNSDWKTVEGITLPFQKTISKSGQQVGIEQISQIKFNPTIDPKLFEKPSQAAK